MQWNEFRSHIRHLSTRDLERVERAFELGKRAHEGQTRKSGEPYFNHPIAVAMMLADFGADADTLIASLLHDTVEDTPITLREIESTFNGSVPTLIDGVTKLGAEDVKGHPTLNEQIETLRKMFTLMQKDVRIMVIKLIDRLHNMQTVEFLPPPRQRQLAEETANVYVKIADRLSMGDIHDELEGMCIAVLEPELHQKLLERRTENEHRGQQIVRSMRSKILHADPESAGHLSLVYEHKTWEKLRSQIEKAGAAVTGLADATVAFVCLSINECYHTMGVLHQLWQRETMSFQDFINSPMLNGYQGLHTTIILEDGTRVRCKIRTQEMHEYARRGITMSCFGSHEEAAPLPWTERISPVTRDTKRQSKEFWESLQSDILGEAIIIHGPGDQAISIPKGSTALDGAFYLFGKDALRVEKILLDGSEVPFFTALQHAASLSATLADRLTVTLEWLTFAKSGYATALIRTALAHESPEKKMRVGKQMLQDLLTARRKGFIEEIESERLIRSIHSLGFRNTRDVFMAIAEGHLDPADAYRALFTRGESPREASYRTAITFTFPTEDLPIVSRLTHIYQAFRDQIDRMAFSQRRGQSLGKTRMQLHVTPQQERSMLMALQAAGATNVQTGTQIRSLSTFIIGAFILMALWGLDPVMAHLLLRTHSIPAIDLMFIRFWSLTIMSGLFLLEEKTRGVPKAPLPYRSPTLWLSAILLIGISLSTYISLHMTLPSHYSIPMTAAGILLTSLVNRKRWKLLLLTWGLLISGFFVLVYHDVSWSYQGITFTLAAVLCFSLFSVISERYKREEHVGARAAQYFFALSLLCTFLTLPLLPAATLESHSMKVIAQMSIFSIVFAGLPYYLYYILLTHKQIDFVLRYSFVIIYTTLAGELLLIPNAMHNLPKTLIAGLLVTLGAVLPLITHSRRNARN